MEVTSEFLGFLQKCNKINQTLRLVPDAQKLISVSENKMAFLIINEPYTVEREVNIYDLREFISVLNLVDDPIITLDQDNYVTIKSADGKQVINYRECQSDYVTSYRDQYPDLKRCIVDVNVSAAQLKSIVTAANTMKLKYLGFVGDGDTIKLVACNRNAGDGKEVNSYKIDLCESDTDSPFEVYFNLENNTPAVMLDEGDLEFSIYSNPMCAKVTSKNKEFLITFDKQTSKIEA